MELSELDKEGSPNPNRASGGNKERRKTLFLASESRKERLGCFRSLGTL